MNAIDDDMSSPWKDHIVKDLEEFGEIDSIQPVNDIIKDRDEYKDKWMRAVADYQNLKKTSERKQASAFDTGRADMLAALLPALDDLERALASGIDYVGIKLVFDKFMQALEANSIEMIAPVDGDEFNYDLHEAVFAEDTDDPQLAGKIRSTLLPGYKIKFSDMPNPIVRHAKVTTWARKNQ